MGESFRCAEYTPAQWQTAARGGTCHFVATIDRRIASAAAFSRRIAGLKCIRRRPLWAAKQENNMRESAMHSETRIRARGHTASDVAREMDALVTGTATAIIAGGLVVVLTMHGV
jgi:hypothetical protein